MLRNRKSFYCHSMIDDFFNSKIFPKFYLKTAEYEIFALGRSPFATENIVGFIPTGKTYNHHFQSGLYSPVQFEMIQSKNEEEKILPFLLKPNRFFHDLTQKKWKERVEYTKVAIQSNLLKKAVLKRKTLFEFNSSVDIESYFKSFKSKTPHLNHFFIQQDHGSAFMGATPELLFKRENYRLKTMALASTISSKICSKTLLEDSKMAHEFNIVKNQIQQVLSKVSRQIKTGETEPKTFNHLTHLHASIEADLKMTDDLKLIELLHPTAAIVGLPKIEAINFVEEIEQEPRNLYSCALGFSTKNNSEFYVGIRSLFLEQNLLQAFCGVGIVEESDPLKEWEELNLKVKAVKIWVNK